MPLLPMPLPLVRAVLAVPIEARMDLVAALANYWLRPEYQQPGETDRAVAAVRRLYDEVDSRAIPVTPPPRLPPRHTPAG